MGFYGDFIGFYGDLMGFYGDLMGFHGILLVIVRFQTINEDSNGNCNGDTRVHDRCVEVVHGVYQATNIFGVMIISRSAP